MMFTAQEISEDTGFPTYEQLKEWCEANAEGRLLILPCKAGDTVWSAEPFKDGKPRKGSIVQINLNASGFCGFWASFDPEPVTAEFISEDIGKTVFLTREEAEAALRGGADG